MSDVVSKTKFFIFLSIICLLINLAVCSMAYLQSEQDINKYMLHEDDPLIEGDIPVNTNVTLTNFAIATGTSFVPYFSIVSVLLLGENLDFLSMLFINLIIAIIGTLQLWLIIVIALNMLPFLNV